MGTDNRPDLSDIHHNDWVDRCFSPAIRPYLRLARIDRPVGLWLTLFPCLAALFQASHGWPTLRTATVFCLGALLMRSAGSTINDIADRNFDAHVERTRFRPLASGAITVRNALWFFFIQMLAAASLLIFLTPVTALLALSVVPLVILYPYCKRFTYWPQAILGAAFNWGMLMAWTEITGSLPVGAILMWLGTVSWQIAYDTAYAYADAKDDVRIGIKSTALLFGAHGKRSIAGFYLLTLVLWSAGGGILGMHPPYAFGMLMIALYLAWQTRRLDLSNPAQSFHHFVHNVLTGLLLAFSAAAGAI
ncbi:4-hydroxybenzoate octaprenyltransferase [Cronobacter sakazakii]|uniref:4-hydroxybenzoate octaprenyltransferase n=1 Tax=Cronobacter sakazakii TaxID=28141 RepID=UPI0015598FBB|nr:4-hydroxybenzoate octaprenyltransferase [Cronobacter sakazakii]ELY2788436.1 4-hydroxybenzoate octaprenyltransferase [Cronobacter sakazakii]EMA8632503.1 4-hydroxybenzoate octaprenyltransferase [Cronobacter sakazakii]